MESFGRHRIDQPAFWLALGFCLATIFAPSDASRAQTRSSTATATNNVQLLEKEGRVEAQLRQTQARAVARTNQVFTSGDTLHTGLRSRATLRLTDLSTLRMSELSEFLVEVPTAESGRGAFSALRGLFYFFHREKPETVRFKTPTASAAIRGTEFHLEVAANGRTVLTMFDGEVELENPLGAIRLISGEQGLVEPGQPPVKTAVLAAHHALIQWCLYYPGVIDPDELDLPAADLPALGESLEKYRAGDLLGALAAYPTGRQPPTPAETIYLGALLLAVGQVEQTDALLKTLPFGADLTATKPAPAQLASALRKVITAVTNLPSQPGPQTLAQPNSASEWLAESYWQQAQANLTEAIAAARRATERSPQFAFAWARVAELEFSFGSVKPAKTALERSLDLAPRNAQAVALRGFLLAAQNRIRDAQAEFDRAIVLDGALGNAWLGRGLCRIRNSKFEIRNWLRGRSAIRVPHSALEDLQVAATLEPQRAILRSYLAKAWTDAGDFYHATNELALAEARDPRDPTATLYRALLLQQANQINSAVSELERSQQLNDNRRVYRSRLLLDQDQAVRGANLATIYRDAGMTDWSVREASKAVNADYANYSAHLFLADSYNALRDARGVNLRYETPWFGQYLLANLLAPVGGSALSPTVTQQEYSRLFDRQRIGLVNATEYLSRGAWAEQVAQFGRLPRSAYALEFDYLRDPGQRRNQAVEDRTYWATFQHEVSLRDTLLFQAQTHNVRAGDLNQYFRPEEANAALRVREQQEPILFAGWHRTWAPGHHTLVLAGWGQSRQQVVNPSASSYLFRRDGDTIDLLAPMRFRQTYTSDSQLFSGELQQMQHAGPHLIIAGARFQGGAFDVDNSHRLTGSNGFNFAAFNLRSPSPQQVEPGFNRQTIYLYDFWQVAEPLQLIGGVAYDRLQFPANHRFGPAIPRERSVDAWEPKLGLIWNQKGLGALRLAWTRGRNGVTFDQSFRLEPVQVAGILQAYRSVVPESRVAANAGLPHEIFGAAWERHWPTRTYAGVEADWLKSDGTRHRGGYDWLESGRVVPSSLSERLNYEEVAVRAGLFQLIGNQASLGARYEWNHATLRRSFPGLPPFLNSDDGLDGTQTDLPTRRRERGDLHRVSLEARLYHPNGWFAVTEGAWWGQNAHDDGVELPAAGFWQWHVQVGWRSPRRRVEASGGVLNLLDEVGNLHPINLHADPPRERTAVATLRFNF